MKKFSLAICAVVALAGGLSVRANVPEFQYVFEPVSTSDGSALSDWGGSLFLDSSASPLGGGSLGDVNMNASFLQTPFGSFSLADSVNVSIGEIAKAPAPFTWNPTVITSMDIMGFVELNEGGNVGDVNFAWQITDASLQIEQPDPSAFGPWVAQVPDSASTLFLFGLAAAALLGFGHSRRLGELAMARR